jgi:hypothetical protein
VIDLNSVRHPADQRPLGWCRGLLADRVGAWVGFSRIRYTALRQNIDWVRRGFRESDRLPPRPTRIARYDLDTTTFVSEIDLEPVGLNAVFSIHRA